MNAGPRISLEKKSLRYMIEIFCRANHESEGLCPDCSGLLDYASERLDRCPFGEEKTSCLKCVVHCYNDEMRERVRAVMRYSGPRMLLHHPLLALRHMMSGLKGSSKGSGTA